ncbi:MAG: hypothetical protein LC753_14870, partial [Acidobacteria bacterium]|nr:hypothetical protein [Acidobacteriota bacterium]
MTDDEADDTAPDFSPDGSQILFQSDRGGGGAYVVSLAGGEPQRLAPGFRSVRGPVWAPDGRSLLFLGRSDRNATVADSFDWWWVKLDGSPPAKVGLLSDASLRLAEAEPAAWTPDEVMFAGTQDLWSVPVSQANGRMLGPPRRLTVSAGAYHAPAIGPDGRIVFASTQNVRVIERAPFDSSDHPRPAVQLYADFAPEAGRPSETQDGTILVFERPAATGLEIWTRNVRTGIEQLITKVESR